MYPPLPCPVVEVPPSMPPTDPTSRAVAYYRVSTARQGRSGLGLAAQRETVEAFAAARGWTVLEAFTEVESGKSAERRPELAQAMRRCRLTGATLVVARLDRLSRDLEFLAALQKGAVPFVAADLPDANTLTLGVMASMAQHERELISARTRAGLAAAKARGVRLGNPRLQAVRNDDTSAATAARSAKARARYADLAALAAVLDAEAGQPLSLRELVERLNEAGCTGPRGGKLAKAHAVRIRRAAAAMGVAPGATGTARTETER